MEPQKIHSGWLNKRGDSVKSWKSRYFVLTDRELTYYENAKCKHKKGSIDLENIENVINRSPPFTSPIFDIVTPFRVYMVQAQNKQEQEEWMRILGEMGNFSSSALTSATNIVQQGIVKEGILNKQGEVRKNWKSRQFTLYLYPLPRLIYCKPGVNTMAKGSIDLRDISNVMPENGNDSSTFLVTVSSGRTFVLQADSVLDMNDWISVITAAVEEASVLGGKPKSITDTNHQRVAKKQADNLIKHGWMKKKGDVVKNWKKRYFVLSMVSDTCAQLKYFVSPDTTLAKGVIDISSIMELTCEPGSCTIELVTQNRTFYCKAESDFVAQDWYTKLYSSQLKIQKATQ